MQDRADKILISALAAFAVVGMAAITLASLGGDLPLPPQPQPPVDPIPTTASTPLTGERWFTEMRAYCNPVDVATRISWTPAPLTTEGTQYEAACWALAGRIDEARAALLRLPADEQWRGAGVVFGAGHPAADAGDELAAGPLMELVVEFWPNHYQALYHAGAAAYERGEHSRARGYLTRFLKEYPMEDGWRSSALEMLAEIG
jgi:tetratricopeptide (TPR) repeat protein